MTELQNLKAELKELKAKEAELRARIKELEAATKEPKVEVSVIKLRADGGIEAVAKAIENLTIKQLKQVIRDNGLDTCGMSTRFKEDKLKAFILKRTEDRFNMGMGFRYYSL